MSAVAVTTRLYCDGQPGGYVPGGACPMHIDVLGGAAVAREVARTRGWELRQEPNGVLDLCPTCQDIPKSGEGQ